MSDREESIEQIDNENGDDNSSSHDERSMTPRDDDSENDSPHSANGHSPRPAGRSRSRSRSRSKSKRYRKSRSRSISHEKSRKYSSKYSSPDHHRSHRSKRSRSPMSSRRRHVGNRDNPPSGRCLGIFGLSIYTQERDLKNVFSKYGPIEDVQIVYDAQTGRSRGFAFVYFENRNHAYDAKERCNGMEIDGRKIRVDFSITQRAHTPTPGIYMGKPTHPRYRSSDRNSSYRGSTSSSYNHRVSSSYYANNHNDSSYSRHHHRRSPSPYYSSSSKDYRRGGGGGGRYSRSRSRSISPQ